MSKLKADWEKEAKDLDIPLDKEVDGKMEEKTIEELSADIDAVNKKADAAKAKGKKKSASKKQESIKILLPVAGAFFLPYNIGQEVKVGKGGIDAKQADELVKAKYAEKV